jgi:hypothetical protein
MAPDLASQVLNDIDAKFAVLETEQDVDLQARYWFELEKVCGYLFLSPARADAL